MCLDSCPMLDEVTEEVYEATYEYVVKILGDGLSVSTAGEPKDWAATWSLKTLDVGTRKFPVNFTSVLHQY